MKDLRFATRINNSEDTGIINLSTEPPTIFCLCGKEQADEIIEAIRNNDALKEGKDPNSKFPLTGD